MIPKIFQKIILVFIVGIILSLILWMGTESILQSLIIGFLYLSLLILIFFLVRYFVTKKLTIFTPVQQWLLKTLVYSVSLSFIYLTGITLYQILFKPISEIKENIIQKILDSISRILSSPFNLDVSEILFAPEIKWILLNLTVIAVLIGIISILGSFVEIKWQEKKQRHALERAELTALRAQIEPHFLFNSLNTIASLIKKDSDKAEKLLLQLSDMFRYIFEHSSKELVELENEIQFTKKYIDLMQARFSPNLKVIWKQSVNNLSCKIPVLIIQPLIENAIRHGWQNKDTAFSVEIELKELSNSIQILVSDDGIVIKNDLLKKIPVPGHALENISERLHLYYKETGLLKIIRRDGKGVSVELKLPFTSNNVTYGKEYDKRNNY